jgi:hypothetical protein
MTSSSSSNVSQRYPERSSFDIRGNLILSDSRKRSNHFIVEENLIAIGGDVRRETGNDVFKTDPQLNEWMQRVRKLGGSSEVDDDERSKRLEEVTCPLIKIHGMINEKEILAQRKARQEKRAG